MTIPPLAELLTQPVQAYLATVMPDGSPQLTQVWIDTDGEHIVVNTVQGIRRRATSSEIPEWRSISPIRPVPSKYWFVRGEVVGVTDEGGAEHIEKLSMRYSGRPYEWYGGRDQVRLIVTIRADSAHSMG